jgi:hypothetical protein
MLEIGKIQDNMRIHVLLTEPPKIPLETARRFLMKP